MRKGIDGSGTSNVIFRRAGHGHVMIRGPVPSRALSPRKMGRGREERERERERDASQADSPRAHAKQTASPKQPRRQTALRAQPLLHRQRSTRISSVTPRLFSSSPITSFLPLLLPAGVVVASVECQQMYPRAHSLEWRLRPTSRPTNTMAVP